MKRLITLIILVLGIAAILVPTAGASGHGTKSGGGMICICPPPTSTQ